MSCLIGGVALYFSYQVGERAKVGNWVGAAQASKMAKVWGFAGIGVGALVFVVMLFSGGGSNSGY